MRASFADSPEFQRLLDHDAGADLVRITLEIARDAYPALDPIVYEARIEELATRARQRCASVDRPRKVLGQINWMLFVEEGFQGNTDDYYDPRNSYLNEVIDRKTGIPISLSLLYWRIAERLGLNVVGLNLPAHFMLRIDVEHGGETVFVDPFHDGALLDRDGCRKQVARLIGQPFTLDVAQLPPITAGQFVTRVLRNLKAIYLRNHEYPCALPVQRRLAALNPSDADELRDLGMIYLRLDRPADAIGPLQACLNAAPGSTSIETIGALLQSARRDVAMRN